MLLEMKIQTERKHHAFVFHYGMLLMYMKIQPEKKHHAFVFHYAPYVYEDTAGEEIPCVCVSPFSFI